MNRKGECEPQSEDVVVTPSGGLARRCGRVKRDGVRCGMPVRSGFDVCWKHGAGSATREASGERRPTGRPPTHGRAMRQRRYRTLRDVVEELRKAQLDLDDSGEALYALHAVLQILADNEERIAERIAGMPAKLASLEEAIEAATLTPSERREMVHAAREARRVVTELTGWLDRVGDAAMRIVTAIKMRADTAARRSQAEQLDSLRTYALIVRDIIWDMLDDVQLDVFEDRLRREVFLPHGFVFTTDEGAEAGADSSTTRVLP